MEERLTDVLRDIWGVTGQMIECLVRRRGVTRLRLLSWADALRLASERLRETAR